MTPVHAILIVIIRLWVASALISAVISLSSLMFWAIRTDLDAGVFHVLSYTQFFVWLLLGVLAWILAPKLSRMVYPKQRDDSVSILVDADALVMIGSFLIGGFYLVQYIPQLLVGLGAIFIEYNSQDPIAEYKGRYHELYALQRGRFAFEQLLKDLFITVVAFWMTFRPRQIAYIFSRVRRAGLHEKAEQ